MPFFYGEEACQPDAKGTPYGVGVHVHSGGGGDRKSGGSSPGFSHSLPITILISFTVAGFRPLPSQVYIYIFI